MPSSFVAVCSRIYYSVCKDQTITCVRFNNASDLLGAAVDGTVAAVTEDTDDSAKAGYWLRRYFAGTYPAGRTGTNFLTNTNALASLRTGLINFFGVTLNCTDDATGMPMSSSTWQFTDLVSAHVGMKIRKRDFDVFNKALLGVVASIKETGNANFESVANEVSGILNSTQSTMVIPSTLSFCDKYSDGLYVTNEALVGDVVSKTVGSVVSSNLRRYFDGSIAGTRNITGSPTLTGNLAAGLIAFFGQTGVLGCTDPDYPAYTGPELRPSHAKLGINAADFDEFNDKLIAVLNGAGVSADDQAAVRGVLDGTEGDIVVSAVSEGPVATPGSDASAVVMSAVVLLAAVLAMFF
jgi:hypothetical protein